MCAQPINNWEICLSLGVLDFAHLAVKQESKLLNTVGTKYLIVFYIIIIHHLWQLHCGTDVLKDGPSVLYLWLLHYHLLSSCVWCNVFPCWWHLSPWYYSTCRAAACEMASSKDKIIYKKTQFDTMPHWANTKEQLAIITWVHRCGN